MQRPPIIKGFKPFGGKGHTKEKVKLLMEEYESIRLLDFEMLTQAAGAKLMNVSRPTFTRIYESARKKIAMAMVLSMQLDIEGGNVALEGNWFMCKSCQAVFELSSEEDIDKLSCPHCSSLEFENINENIKTYKKPRFNYHQAVASNEEGYCVCTECGLKVSHKRGTPCRKMNCPKCGNNLCRE
jgi:predicted DNA-binding protein (UPF0251 family)/DNA-directed RNA polymerase subunit RPC12/RpoP